MHLVESQRIGVLMMIGYGNRTRKESEMCDLFNVKYPDHHIIQATVNKIKWKFRTVGHVSDKYKGRNSKIPEDKKLDNFLSFQENPNNPFAKLHLSNLFDSGHF
ncbi:hypothetical protein ABEB36_011344 [Hypothenemus hampei]|uniref:DUF4817 domain-containing protein n=1 Tax=Hypothenemus hampei TaxID=57062 RepID=A0ABD1EF48_HYPHA